MRTVPMRMVDRDWTMEECLQAMDDLDHVVEFGRWKGPIPGWAVQCAEELHSHPLGASVLATAYEKCAKTFRRRLRGEKPYSDVSLKAPEEGREKGNKDSPPTKFPEGG
jgi:hypothetical protein